MTLGGPIGPGYELYYGMTRPIWTPRGFIKRGHDYKVWCRRCGHTTTMPMAKFVEAGLGDLPISTVVGALICSRCGERRHHGYEVMTQPHLEECQS